MYASNRICIFHTGKMYVHPSFVLLLLLHIAVSTISTSTVYNVIPDEATSTDTCESCKTLGQYLKNKKRYFTSNSKFYFRPGRYSIYYDLILYNVPNVSLIGSSPNNTIIECDSKNSFPDPTLVGIVMINMTNLSIINLTISNCLAPDNYVHYNQSMHRYYESLIIISCCNVHLQHIILVADVKENGGRLLAFNTFGKATLSGITANEIKVYYTDDYDAETLGVAMPLNHTLTIDKYTALYHSYIEDRQIYDVFHDANNRNNPYSYDYDYKYSQDDDYNNNNNNLDGMHKFNFDDINTMPALVIDLSQNLFGVTIKIVNTSLTLLEYYEISVITIDNLGIHRNRILFKNCRFTENYFGVWHDEMASLIKIKFSTCNTKSDKVQLAAGSNTVEFNNCLFSQNYYEGRLITVTWEYNHCQNNETIHQLDIKEQIIIAYCSFEHNKFIHILQLVSYVKAGVIAYFVNTHFKNMYTTHKGFKDIISRPAIHMINVSILMEGPITFCAINITRSLIYSNAKVIITNNITFSSIKSENIFSGQVNFTINLISNVYVYVHNVSIRNSIFAKESNINDLYLLYLLKNYQFRTKLPITIQRDLVEFHSLCFFQYYQFENKTSTSMYTIAIQNSNNNNIFDFNTGNINCKLTEGSLYHRMNPLTVHQQHFQLINKTGRYPLFNSGLLCYCLDKVQSNCLTNTIGPFFPGETFEIYLMLNPSIVNDIVLPVSVKIVDQEQPGSVCKVSSLLQAEQLVTKTCTKISYTILAENEKSCKLILYSVRWRYPTYYYVELRNCPFGFVFSPVAKSCICEPILTTYGIIGDHDCDINDQTILRPADSWISTTTHNNSYTYHISLQCPFHYCLPHSSHLNFSTPNSQCQFNRSGLLCGHCQQGLSTVFSSSHCKTCSDIYLLLVIPIIVVGFILVLLLFILNLTVTDGTVNGFILYANIISINTPILFPNVNHFTPAYTFISLANLDLGIQTCFYNGMDDYAKMWLQLAFPFYLIFIATLIIIASRYSTRVQRLTARRALPVLATLFLLSYTKILRIVSSVLFFYSTITHLPSKHTTVVWSVDANVPLFGVKFTILFIVCLFLFLILVPFNVILLFTRTLSRFRFINKFKPLLDAYQGPYKIKFYYWTGLQLLIRVIFFGTSSLDRNLSLTVGIALFSLIGGIQGVLKPFKNEGKYFQEQVFLMNITILYAFLLYNQEAINTMAVNIMITMAAIHFTLIITYHIITYVCSAAIKHKIKLSYNTIFKWINRLQRRPHNDNQFELQDNVRCNIPEAVNYHEFRESMLNQN